MFSFVDRFYLIFLFLGLLASSVYHYFFQADTQLELSANFILYALIISPILEELLFRGLLQKFLSLKLGHFRWKKLTLSNFLTSICFASLHVFLKGDWEGAMTFFPSLIFGFIWDRYKMLLPPILLHAAFNLFYFGAAIFLASAELTR